MTSETRPYKEIREKLLSGVAKIADPVRATLTPKGSNVIYEDELGNFLVTNDGIKIGRQIQPEDSVENAAVSLVRQASDRTNDIAGDGTSTTVMLAQTFIQEGFKLIDAGWNGMELKRAIDTGVKRLAEVIRKTATKIKNDKDLADIAFISSNNDTEIAEVVTDCVRHTGEFGLISLEKSPTAKTEVKKEEGFEINSGMVFPHFSNQRGKFAALYEDVKILITDKRIYHAQEVINILKPLKDAGYDEVVIVARDFIGQAPNVFLTNHVERKMKILLVKDPLVTETDMESLEDLADYCGTKVLSDKKGRLMNELKLEDYGTVKKVFSSGIKTFIVSDDNVQKTLRVKAIKELLDKDKDSLRLKQRYARMTSGTASIFIGANTTAELNELSLRYEDAISACRASLRDGYVVGGGLTLHHAIQKVKGLHPDIRTLLERVCDTPLKQIAINCNLHLPQLMAEVEMGRGYNALSEKYEDLIISGIIEPTAAVCASVENAASAANMILSSAFLITINRETNDKTRSDNSKK